MLKAVFVTQTALANAESCVCRYFYLVQELARPASGRGQVAVRWLEERPDGLWHPSTQTWDECRGSLCVVRTQPCRDKNGRRSSLCAAALRLWSWRTEVYSYGG